MHRLSLSASSAHVFSVYSQVLSMLFVVVVAGALGGYAAASAAVAAFVAVHFEEKEATYRMCVLCALHAIVNWGWEERGK